MARNLRDDGPGIWHHVMNRGIGKRHIFNRDDDRRFFLERMDAVERKGLARFHCFGLMTTHFHVLVESHEGRLSDAMQGVTGPYVQYFNRVHGRDGPLFRGRFHSKIVDSLQYRYRLISYIDFNPVHAGLVSDPDHFPWGSARFHLGRNAPRWLASDWIEEVLEPSLRRGLSWVEAYREAFGHPPTGYDRFLIESKGDAMAKGAFSLDNLIRLAPAALIEQFERTAFLADGMPLSCPVADPATVHAVLDAQMDPSSIPGAGKGRRVDTKRFLSIVLLRTLCGCTIAACARANGVCIDTLSRVLA